MTSVVLICIALTTKENESMLELLSEVLPALDLLLLRAIRMKKRRLEGFILFILKYSVSHLLADL